MSEGDGKGFGLMNDGQDRQVRGTACFDILLGSLQGMSIVYGSLAAFALTLVATETLLNKQFNAGCSITGVLL